MLLLMNSRSELLEEELIKTRKHLTEKKKVSITKTQRAVMRDVHVELQSP